MALRAKTCACVVWEFISSGSQKARSRMAFRREIMEMLLKRPKQSAR
jgi:hypothetical protein